ncbi:hypothetical protein COU74_02910 [Candidatus Peregrinibacteria bacterium CG10_big_fil_rev_8_21_14_0_10_36_19]|nr:MAG: hypothetical protein COU74_02910 [Candidatus Peregrinibacteria bacterium CG10_big_fil_rev_8_21_14_0_10_36_19]
MGYGLLTGDYAYNRGGSMSPHENTKKVSIQFLCREEVEKNAPENSVKRFFWKLFRRPAPKITEVVETPVAIEVTAGYEDKGDYATLWMTSEEAKPLKDRGVQISILLIDHAIFNGRGLIFNVPKQALSFVG